MARYSEVINKICAYEQLQKQCQRLDNVTYLVDGIMVRGCLLVRLLAWLEQRVELQTLTFRSLHPQPGPRGTARHMNEKFPMSLVSLTVQDEL